MRTLTLLILLLTTCYCQEIGIQHLEIRNLHNDPVVLIKKKDCRIQTSYIKFVHPINISKIEENVLLISKISRQLNDHLDISKLVVEKSRTLINNLRQIKPIAPRRVRRWDALGTTWKWLAGTPDADDLRMLNATSNELINQNNQQIVINQMVNQRIQDMSKTINQLIDQHIDNKILLEQYDAISLLLYMDSINSILVEIQDTILRAKITLPNNKLLTLQEILWIESTLNQQGIMTEFPEQALNYVTPKIATKDNTLLYILQIPQLQKTSSQIFEILPLIVNGTIIIDAPLYAIKSGTNWFKTGNPQNFIQPVTELTVLNDKCIHRIVLGVTSKCNVVEEHSTFISMVTDTEILINNAQDVYLSSDCGPQNRSLTGNFLITFQNCTIYVNNQPFTSNEKISNETQVIQGAFHNLIVNRTILEQQSIQAISNLTLVNRKRMESLDLKQYSQQNWILSIFGGLTTTTIIIIGITIYICLRRRKIVIKIRQPRMRPAIIHNTDIRQPNHTHP